jgi:hypothetical protein
MRHSIYNLLYEPFILLYNGIVNLKHYPISITCCSRYEDLDFEILVLMLNHETLLLLMHNLSGNKIIFFTRNRPVSEKKKKT